MQFSLVIPVHNEEQNIALLYRSVDSNLKGFFYEVIVVDNGSDDGIDNIGDHIDADGDGVSVCNDCNDANVNINPGKSENAPGVCNDGFDNNCNGQTDCEDSSCDGVHAFLYNARLTLAPTGMCCSGAAVSLDTTENCGGCGIECPIGAQCVRRTCFDLNGLKGSILDALNNNPVVTGCFVGLLELMQVISLVMHNHGMIL